MNDTMKYECGHAKSSESPWILSECEDCYIEHACMEDARMEMLQGLGESESMMGYGD